MRHRTSRIVLVLDEWFATSTKVVIAQRTPGGEPLWNVPDGLARFGRASEASGKRLNKRLPRITQGDAFAQRGSSFESDL
jgi:hypothetical protein